MPIIAKPPKDGEMSDFVPCPAGTMSAVLCDVVDLGDIETTWQGKSRMSPKVLLTFQVSKPMPGGKPFVVSQRFTNSLGTKASLRKILMAWRGCDLDEDEVENGIDLESLIGRGAILSVVHVVKPKRDGTGDLTYANIASIAPLMDGMTALPIIDFVRKVNRMDSPAERHYMDEPPIPSEAELAAVPADDDIPF